MRESLPAGVDVELGPITTGLGEIFQYTLVSKDPRNTTRLSYGRFRITSFARSCALCRASPM